MIIIHRVAMRFIQIPVLGENKLLQVRAIKHVLEGFDIIVELQFSGFLYEPVKFILLLFRFSRVTIATFNSVHETGTVNLLTTQSQRVKLDEIRAALQSPFSKYVDRIRRVHTHAINRNERIITRFRIKHVILGLSLRVLVLEFYLFNVLVPLVREKNQLVIHEVWFHYSSREGQHDLVFPRVRPPVSGLDQRLVSRSIQRTNIKTICSIYQGSQLVRFSRRGQENRIPPIFT